MNSGSRQFPNHPPEQDGILLAKRNEPIESFVPFQKEDIERCIPELFDETVAKACDRLAVLADDGSYTYKELNDAGNRIAKALVERFGKKNDAIAVLLDQGAQPIVASVGLLKAGKILVALDSSFPSNRLAYIVKHSKAKAVLTNKRNAQSVNGWAQRRIELIDIENFLAGSSTTNLSLALTPDTVSHIAYTSGSTGNPKGVAWSHRSLLHNTIYFVNAHHVRPNDRVALLLNSASNGFPASVLRALLAGAVLIPFDSRQEGLSVLAPWLIRKQITIYRSLASTFRCLLDTLTGEERFPHLRLIQVSGESMSKRDVERCRKHFSPDSYLVHTYGSTETGDIAAYTVAWNTQISGEIVPIGYPVSDKTIVLIDDEGNQVKPGGVGEIEVKSRYLPLGYWEDPELTHQKYLIDRANEVEERTYQTGDLGRFLPDGCLIHLGRKDSMVKIRGYRVDIGEIEMAINGHCDIKASAVVAWSSEAGDKYLAAYVVPRTKPGPTTNELVRFLKTKLPDYMLPSVMVTLDSLPLTGAGKIDRRALPPSERVRPYLDQPYRASGSKIEQQLAGIWEQVLDVRPIGMHDNFFDLGGHSLAATRVLSQVIKKFQLEIPVQSLFAAPTVAEMAAVIEAHQGNKVSEADLENMLAELESLSDDEARRLIAEESGKPSRGDQRD